MTTAISVFTSNGSVCSWWVNFLDHLRLNGMTLLDMDRIERELTQYHAQFAPRPRDRYFWPNLHFASAEAATWFILKWA